MLEKIAREVWLAAVVSLPLFLYVTRSPEMRAKRTRFTLLLLLAGALLYSAFGAAAVLQFGCAFVLVRFGLFVVLLLRAQMTGPTIGTSLGKTLFGLAEPTVTLKQPISFSLPKHLRACGNIREALKVTRERLAEDPENFTGLMLLATIYAEDMGKLGKAKDLVKVILRSDAILAPHKDFARMALSRWTGKPVPDLDAHSSCELARYHRDRQEFGLAVKCLEEALRKKADNVEAMLLLATIQAEDLNRPKEALQLLERILGGKAARAEQTALARQYWFKWSAPFVEQASEADGEIPPQELGEIAALRSSRQFGTAVQKLQEALDQSPGKAELVFQLATIYAEDCQDTRTARRIVSDFLSQHPAPKAKARGEELLNRWSQLAAVG